ncbi:hypothetical protein G3T36_07680 [Diaminobutyricibacter tongyongensis]|uniref:DUF5666 domain-containing protein n=2 Tax=Leifsonia tongyongensis TaxID=1268043 RepID=A0A6L9XWD7_9MICO|nr:hypothetical protein [Diaminobutyricibacter tongyongensis]
MPTEPPPPAQEPQPAYAQQTVPLQPAYAQQTVPLQPVQQQQPVQQSPVHEPFYKRYGLAFAISTLVLGVFVILAFFGVGAFAVGTFISHAGAGISHVLEQGNARPFPGFPGEGNGKAKGNGQGKGQNQGEAPGPGTKSGNQLTVVRGTITSISGSTWTVDTQRGVSLTVEVTSSTQFGTPVQSGSASDFAVGQEIIVVGSRSGDTVTADRVLDLTSFKQQLPTTPGTPVTPGPSPSK